MAYLLDNDKFNGNGGKVYIDINGRQSVLGTINELKIDELKIDEVEQTVKHIKSIGVQHDKISGWCAINKEENHDFFNWMEDQFNHLETERQSFAKKQDVTSEMITLYVVHNENLYSRIGTEYDNRFDAMNFLKQYAQNDGYDQTFAMCTNGLMTHIIKWNDGFEIIEIPDTNK